MIIGNGPVITSDPMRPFLPDGMSRVLAALEKDYSYLFAAPVGAQS